MHIHFTKHSIRNAILAVRLRIKLRAAWADYCSTSPREPFSLKRSDPCKEAVYTLINLSTCFSPDKPSGNAYARLENG